MKCFGSFFVRFFLVCLISLLLGGVASADTFQCSNPDPPDLQAKIFQPFFSTKKNGTGLGLPIVQRLVSHLEGTLDLASEPGKGTTFTLFLKRPDAKKELNLPQLIKSFQ